MIDGLHARTEGLGQDKKVLLTILAIFLVRLMDAHLLGFPRECAAADHHLQPTLRQNVKLRELACKAKRMMKGDDKDRYADMNPLGPVGDHGGQLKRSRLGDVIVEVVLRQPDRSETKLFGELCFQDELAIKLLGRLGLVQPVTG
jgi:hypothetical protein